ncbi:MAG: hypothetical protein JSW58_14150, partial [Candidatus Latescibacterota bacterium]
MSVEHSGSRRHTEYVLFAAVVLCVASSFFMMDFVPDDSYISYRYAENLANGHGLRFNTEEQPVEGYSNLLWILLCAVFYLAGFDLPTAMPTVGVLLGVLNVTLLWILFRRRDLPPLQMLFPLLILASSGPFIMYEISGMEMPLFSLLLLCLILRLDRVFTAARLIDYLLVAFVCVLLSLCRPEGIVSFPVTAVAVIWLKKRGETGCGDGRVVRNMSISFAAFVAIIAVYHVWRVGYFGEWLPTPLLSKGGGGKSVLYAWGENLHYYFLKQSDYFPPVGYYYAALIILAITGLRFSRSEAAHRKSEVVTIVLVITYAVVYFNFRDWMPGMRYHSAYVGLMLFPAVYVQGRFFESPETKRRMTPFWLIGIMAVVMNFGVLAQLRVITKRA